MSIASPFHPARIVVLSAAAWCVGIGTCRSASPPVQWMLETQRRLSGPAVFSGARVYVGSEDRGMYAASASDGRALWRTASDDAPWGGPSCASGLVVWTDRGGTLHAAIAPDGRVAWTTKLPAPPVGPALATPHGAVVALADSTLRAYANHDGKQRWKTKLGAPFLGSPCAGWASVVGVTARGDVIACSAEKGTIQWRRKLPEPSRLPLVSDGRSLYLCPGGAIVTSLDARSGRPRWARGLPQPATRLVPAMGRRGITVVDATGYRMYDESGRCIVDVRAEPNRAGEELFPLSESAYLTANGSGEVALYYVATVDAGPGRTRDVPSGISHETWRGPVAHGAVVGVAAHPTRGLVAVSSADGILYALTIPRDGS